MIDDTLIPVMGPDGVMTTAVKKRVPKPAVLPSSAPVPAPEVQPDIGIRPEIKLLLDETDALLKQVSVHQVPTNNIQENTSGIRPEIQALLDETDTLLK